MLSAVLAVRDPARVHGSFSSAARRPQKPIPFIPYIYIREELSWLLDGVTSYQKRWCKLEPITFRALLLLM
jgi:hypothetical protein